MAPLTQRMTAVEERTDRLELRFVAFMDRTEGILERMRAEHALDREESARFRETAERDREESARFRETAERDREESARFRETADRDREESARFRETVERDQEKTTRIVDSWAETLKEMNRRWGELANKMGTVVEDIVAPSIQRLARERFDCGTPRYFAVRTKVEHSDDPSRQREFDALYVGTRAVLLNETKSSPRIDDVRDFESFLRSGDFARYFPQYAKLPIVPAFSSLSIPDDMVTYLTRRGIYAIAMGDQAMQVLNLEAVRRRG